MAYVQTQLIYGIPLLSDSIQPPVPSEPHLCFPHYDRSPLLQALLYDTEGPRPDGLLSFYSGDSDTKPFAFGVAMTDFDATFDEFHHHWELEADALTVTAELDQTFQTMLAALPMDLRSEVMAYGPARFFLLWMTS